MEGQAVYSNQPKKQESSKFFCECITTDQKVIYLVIRANDRKSATQRVHKEYNIQYVLDVLTPLQMHMKRLLLRPRQSIYGGSGVGHYS